MLPIRNGGTALALLGHAAAQLRPHATVREAQPPWRSTQPCGCGRLTTRRALHGGRSRGPPPSPSSSATSRASRRPIAPQAGPCHRMRRAGDEAGVSTIYAVQCCAGGETGSPYHAALPPARAGFDCAAARTHAAHTCSGRAQRCSALAARRSSGRAAARTLGARGARRLGTGRVRRRSKSAAERRRGFAQRPREAISRHLRRRRRGCRRPGSGGLRGRP